LGPKHWVPGTRPFGLLDGFLIGVGSLPLETTDPSYCPMKFGAGPISIGWGARCAMRVPKAEGVARQHARLWLRHDGQLMVHNVDRRYMTLVDGIPTDCAAVHAV